MNSLSEIKREQDEKFDKYFITDDGDYSYVGNDENSSTVKDFMHTRDLAIENAVRAELDRKFRAHAAGAHTLEYKNACIKLLALLTTSPSR